jgi:hypothetical protein
MAYELGTKLNLSGVSAFYTEADGCAFALEIERDVDLVRPYGWAGLPRAVVGGINARGTCELFVDAKPGIPSSTSVTAVFTANTGVSYTLKGIFTQLATGGDGAQRTALKARYQFVGAGTASTDTVT